MPHNPTPQAHVNRELVPDGQQPITPHGHNPKDRASPTRVRHCTSGGASQKEGRKRGEACQRMNRSNCLLQLKRTRLQLENRAICYTPVRRVHAARRDAKRCRDQGPWPTEAWRLGDPLSWERALKATLQRLWAPHKTVATDPGITGSRRSTVAGKWCSLTYNTPPSP